MSLKTQKKQPSTQGVKQDTTPPQIFQIVPLIMLDLAWKFHENPFMWFYVMLFTYKPRDKPTEMKTWLSTFGGGNNSMLDGAQPVVLAIIHGQNPTKKGDGCILLCFIVVIYHRQPLMYSRESFTHILQSWFSSTDAIITWSIPGRH